MRQLIRSNHFALVELIIVILCGAVWIVKPEWGIWFILIALLPIGLSVFIGRVRFEPIDLLVLAFAITAWLGYWAAYDQKIAWHKAWLIMLAVLLYFSLKSQPKENWPWISGILFCIGISVSLYYFLTHDFITAPRKLEFVNSVGRWIMEIRPPTAWTPIHPNYVAGIIAVTIPFIFYPVWIFKNSNNSNSNNSINYIFYIVVVAGLMLVCGALVMATSRGVVLAIVSGVGAWLLWRLINLDRIKRRFNGDAVFPILLLVYLSAMVAFLFLGPAQSGSIFSGSYFFGNGSRAELLSRSFYLLLDYPITGGGLGSFPGLYSQYLLNIPFFNVSNSHNLFMDVAIEQGLFGGLAFLSLYMAALWMVSSSIAKGGDDQVFKWVILFTLVVSMVHGMVDNYLYNGVGSMFCLFLIGLSMNRKPRQDLSVGSKLDLRTVVVLAIVWGVVIFANLNPIRSIWYANLGAVQLSKVELSGFPDGDWAGGDIVTKLDDANASLQSSLQYDPANRTANQRLGMISMLRRDFQSAAAYLEVAHAQAPEHRGVIKSLAYSYVWLGEMKNAEKYLVQIPESREELDVYIWWWEAQGRSDLSEDASLALDILKSAPSQP